MIAIEGEAAGAERDPADRPGWKTVRVNEATYNRLKRVADELGKAFTEGRTSVVAPSDLTDRVTFAAVINRALDVYEDHRRRSARRSK